MDPGNGKRDSMRFHPENDRFNGYSQTGMVLINRDRREFMNVSCTTLVSFKERTRVKGQTRELGWKDDPNSHPVAQV